jgi:hypothetical protein
VGSNVLHLDGFRWFGQNRTALHTRAKCGSGGIGILIRECLFSVYNIHIVDSSYEGILWIKFTHKTSSDVFYSCVCYLPPVESTRDVNVNEFYDTLLCQIHRYGGQSLLYTTGDFNGRIGDKHDYIPGVDDIPVRHVVDFVSNSHGNVLCNFLINTNCCVLNGRNTVRNDYTYISTNGSSVVDYCILPYECVNKFSDFTVYTMSELMEELDMTSRVDPKAVPDHSLLVWNIDICSAGLEAGVHDTGSIHTSYRKYKLDNIPQNFLVDKLSELEHCINTLERGVETQDNLDNAYNELVVTLKEEMQEKLAWKNININNGVNNKRRRVKKPWWTDQLCVLWNSVCSAERDMLRSKNRSDKSKKRQIFLTKRKSFDRETQRCKRQHWRNNIQKIDNLEQTDGKHFWKEIGRISVGQERRKHIPMEIVLPDGSISRDTDTVLSGWETCFSTMFNPPGSTQDTDNGTCPDDNSTCDSTWNVPISLMEVMTAIHSLKNNKAVGFDDIPAEILKCPRILDPMWKLCNHCFVTGSVPSAWSKGIINPIFKSSTADIRDPLSYRGITLVSVPCKVYCGILNARLGSWERDNDILHDAQNGFRRQRSTTDQLSSLTSVIETRKLKRQSTFTAFIDFKKAYDCIDRSLLFTKLQDLGINGQMYRALVSLYKNVESCVRLNGLRTNWFAVNCGLKQGCLLSPLLFNLFINDLVTLITSLDMGIDIGDEKLSILLYADDIVLLAETESDLQTLLNALNSWCVINKMTVNSDKSNVVHFRPTSVDRTVETFTCGDEVIQIVEAYRYLGLILTEHLDYNTMAKNVAASAGRALGLVIAKYKSFGSLPFGTYTKLFDSMVWSTINYGSAIWGDRQFSCINAVQQRAARFFLGVGRYTPNSAVSGDIGWTPPLVKQLKTVIGQWYRLKHMQSDRINAKVFKWASHCSETIRRCKNWNYRVHSQIRDADMDMLTIDEYSKREVISVVCENVRYDLLTTWFDDINRVEAACGGGRGGNKLRTYKGFKLQFGTESYVRHVVVPSHRSAYAKFRCGVAPIRLETGRYERLAIGERKCIFCDIDTVETEEHVLLHCSLHQDLRDELFSTIANFYPDFIDFSVSDKLSIILSSPILSIMKESSRICKLILDRRRYFLRK